MSEERNHCLLQGFEWNVPSDQKQYQRLSGELPQLERIGVDALWLPPACKAAGGSRSNGYDIYDLYDLGEFDQKGSRATKWGSKEDLEALRDKANTHGMHLIFDAVLNHRAGADRKEKCCVEEVDPADRNKTIGKPREIEAWFGFDFRGRADKYSSQKYNWHHFSGTDYDASTHTKGIYRIASKRWSSSVGKENGNADYLMFSNVDYSNPEVQADVANWGSWVVKQLHLKGFRFDACQHFSERFTSYFISTLEKEFGTNNLFFVGEFWSSNREEMLEYLDKMHHFYTLFDSPLVYNFSTISRKPNADLRTVFKGSLVEARPRNAVTVVMNHDTQPGQAMDTPIEAFFKPLAYSLILLRAQGYPSVFYGDLYGLQGKHAEPPACGGRLPDIILARKLYAYGDQNDYWDSRHCIGFVRRGTEKHPDGLACVMSNTGPSKIKMLVGKAQAGQVWTDVLRFHDGQVNINERGVGVFPCSGKSVSVWVNSVAPGRSEFGKFSSEIYGNP